ncbi:protein of unknown function DUF43 [[Leptolyngbya] sp. PCC 7376]|uniref:bis-aminopropyl spermidine synthase family protein n=1 Tax=[Leptolyngbya] sp. PCC 7376 TaxID=111781 RepID=UPI00029EDCAD|nr:bis-aminopropyl spermidine synthase family protein [[Leptolyngbya] sp. PCC 7376]AFY37814.1 protein of unknown function DUF43 [[Leptolyngbya] sp. PCC 7376]
MKTTSLVAAGFGSLLCSSVVSFGAIAIVNAQIPTTFEVGDTFELHTKTQLQGLTNDYFGYTETESDRRTYTVSDITGDVITWKVDTEFSYSDNEGGNTSRSGNFTVKTHAKTREYLEETFDGFPIDKDYNTFDFAWFYLPPGTAQPDTSIQILGDTFTIAPATTLQKGGFNQEAIPASQAEPSQRIVNNTEYDDDGEWTLDSQTTNYFYGPTNGILLYGDWEATGYTDYGSFRWTSTTTLSTGEVIANETAPTPPAVAPTTNPAPPRKTTPSQPQNPLLDWLQRLVLLNFAGAGVTGSVMLRRKALRNHVEKVIAFAKTNQGDQSEILTRSLSAWQANDIKYQDLLANIDPDHSFQLREGMYVINDVDDRLGIVDIKADKRLSSQLLTSKKHNLILLYRLALGIANANDTTQWHIDEHPDNSPNNINLAKIPEQIQPYIEPSKGFAIADPSSLSAFQHHISLSSPLEPIKALLARRKMMDYSLGQAPLSPASHERKVKEILNMLPRQVLLVGDDDLVAISLARQGVEVCILEIDPYTCALISHIAEQEKLPITIYQHDLRKALPAELNTKFDLFVTDSDFTIEAFFLFLNRGLSLLNPDGIGLINFENKGGQLFKAKYMLELLQVKVLREVRDRWTYNILQNVKVEVGRRQVGKTVHIDYETDIRLGQAQYSSLMFCIQRTNDTQIILTADQDFAGDSDSIYDYDDD